MSSSLGIHSEGTSGEMDRCLSQNSDAALSKRTGDRHRSALHSRNFRYPTVGNDLGKSNDHNSSGITVASPEEEDAATVHSTSGSKPNNTSRLSQNVSPLHSACSVNNRCSSSRRDERLPVYNYNVTNLRNRDSRRRNGARECSHLSRVLSIMARYVDLVFRRSVPCRTDCRWKSGWRIFLPFFIYLLYPTLCAADINQCAIGLTTPGCKFLQLCNSNRDTNE